GRLPDHLRPAPGGTRHPPEAHRDRAQGPRARARSVGSARRAHVRGALGESPLAQCLPDEPARAAHLPRARLRGRRAHARAQGGAARGRRGLLGAELGDDAAARSTGVTREAVAWGLRVKTGRATGIAVAGTAEKARVLERRALT